MSGNGDRIKESNVLEKWATNFPEVVTQWLPKIQIKKKNAYHLYMFCKWANKTPTELLALKSNPASKEAEKLLDNFVATDLPMTNPVKVWCVNAVKSFFKHNYADLARASGAITLEKIKPYNKPSKEELRKLWSWALNPRDKAILTFVCSTAIAKETLSEIKWKHLEQNWEKVELPCIDLPSDLIKGHGRGKYKGVRQITFLTPEAKRDLISYEEWLERNMGRSVKPEDHIFRETYKPYRPESYSALGWAIWTLSKRTGIKFSLHDARRHVETALEEVKIHPNWARKIRGRKVRGEEAPYSQPAIDQLREKFREAVPLLEFTSDKPTVTKEMIKEEVTKVLDEETLKSIADRLHVPIEQVRIAMRSKKTDWEKLLTKRKTETDEGDCADNKHCQKIVTEEQLPQLLANGWTFVATLPSGKCVVSNEI